MSLRTSNPSGSILATDAKRAKLKMGLIGGYPATIYVRACVTLRRQLVECYHFLYLSMGAASHFWLAVPLILTLPLATFHLASLFIFHVTRRFFAHRLKSSSRLN